jgi:hypothetical protein
MALIQLGLVIGMKKKENPVLLPVAFCLTTL